MGNIGHKIGVYCRHIKVELDCSPRLSSSNISTSSADISMLSQSPKKRTLSRLISSKRHSNPSSSSSSIPVPIPPPTEQRHWARLFGLTPNLEVITIKCPSVTVAWQKQPPLDQTLSAIRAAVEATTLPKLRRVNLNPIHVLGLLAFRWTVGYADASWMAGNVWANITQIELQLFHPGSAGLNRDQQIMSMKVLHSFLEGIADQCQKLTFCWLGQKGVAPVGMVNRAVAKGTGRFSAPEINWPVLDELWMGNVGVSVREVCRIMTQGMPRIRALFVDGDLTDDTEDDKEMWKGIINFECNSRLVWKFDRRAAVWPDRG
jgi:hypothetical protein